MAGFNVYNHFSEELVLVHVLKGFIHVSCIEIPFREGNQAARAVVRIVDEDLGVLVSF